MRVLEASASITFSRPADRVSEALTIVQLAAKVTFQLQFPPVVTGSVRIYVPFSAAHVPHVPFVMPAKSTWICWGVDPVQRMQV